MSDKIEARPRRLTLVCRIVAAANDNARNYHLTGPKRLAAHVALRIGGKIAPTAILSRFDWIYDFDTVAETP